MAKLWQYSIAVVITILIWAAFLWAMFGRNAKVLCPNDSSSDSHPLIFVPSVNRCYALYTQGPCREGRWLTIEGLKVSCAENNCTQYFNNATAPEEQKIVPFGDRCYKLGDICGPNGRQILYADTGYLNCTVRFSTLSVGAPGSGGSCPKGTFQMGGVCLPADDIDLD